MPIWPDHALVLVLAVVFPVRASVYAFGRIRRAAPEDLPHMRIGLYRQGMVVQWGVVALTAALWVWQARRWTDLGLVPRLTGGFLGVLLGVILVAGTMLWQQSRRGPDAAAVARLHRQLVHLERMLPHTRTELRWFNRLAITAGVCEEILYRGYLVWYLGHWLPPVPAFALAAVVFGLAHAYQGPRGTVLTGLVGGFLGAVYALSGSLFPGILIHALMDLQAGQAAFLAFGALEPPPATAAAVGPGDAGQAGDRLGPAT